MSLHKLSKLCKHITLRLRTSSSESSAIKESTLLSFKAMCFDYFATLIDNFQLAIVDNYFSLIKVKEDELLRKAQHEQQFISLDDLPQEGHMLFLRYTLMPDGFLSKSSLILIKLLRASSAAESYWKVFFLPL